MSESQETFAPSFTDLAAVCSVLIFTTCRSGLVPICEPGRQIEPLPA